MQSRSLAEQFVCRPKFFFFLFCVWLSFVSWSCCGRLLWLVVAVVVWLRLCVLVCGGALRLASLRLSSLRISSPLISSSATVVTFAANYIRSIRLLTRITYAACTGRHQTFILERVRRANPAPPLVTQTLQLDFTHTQGYAHEQMRQDHAEHSPPPLRFTTLPHRTKLCEFLQR